MKTSDGPGAQKKISMINQQYKKCQNANKQSSSLIRDGVIDYMRDAKIPWGGHCSAIGNPFKVSGKSLTQQ